MYCITCNETSDFVVNFQRGNRVVEIENCGNDEKKADKIVELLTKNEIIVSEFVRGGFKNTKVLNVSSTNMDSLSHKIELEMRKGYTSYFQDVVKVEESDGSVIYNMLMVNYRD